MKLSRAALLVRIVHGLATLYLLACLIVLFVAVWQAQFDALTLVAVVSLAIEGFVVFILNRGDCPLIHIQRRVDDAVPFFALFLPKIVARQVIPVVGTITLVGILALVIRLGYR